MEDNKVNVKQVIAIGGAFMGFVIGSSFASGQECLQYFTGFGTIRSIGVGVIALILYAWFVSTIVEDGRALKLNNSGKMFNFYLGKYLGFALEWFTPIMLFFVYSMMISGAGSTFEEYYHIDGNIGRAIMIIASLGTVLLGLKKLVTIIGYIAPVLLVVTIVIGIISIVNNPEGVAEADANLKTVEVNTNFHNWIISGLMYGAYTVTGVVGGVVKRCKRVGGLVFAMIVTGIVCDFVLTDQYLAIMVPSRMYQKAFDERGLSRSFLSRTSEDGATLWSPMIPWNGCGAYQRATLGVDNWKFGPWAFMNIINPIYAIVISYLGIGIKYKEYDNLEGAELKAAKAKKKAEFAAAKEELKKSK